jgi:hypothetical protein
MIDFESYLIFQVVSSVVGVVIIFPLALLWLKCRNRQRDEKRKLKNEQS